MPEKENLLGIELIYTLHLGKREIFVMLSYSIHEHEMCKVFLLVQVYICVFQERFPLTDLAYFLSLFSSIFIF